MSDEPLTAERSNINVTFLQIRKTFKRKKEIWKTLKVFAYFRKRIFASSVVPVGHRSSLTDKVATFKVSCVNKKNAFFQWLREADQIIVVTKRTLQ